MGINDSVSELRASIFRLLFGTDSLLSHSNVSRVVLICIET